MALKKIDDRFAWAGNLNDTFDLEIENINSGDDGIYRCQIAGTTKSWNITIKVQGKDKLITKLTDDHLKYLLTKDHLN